MKERYKEGLKKKDKAMTLFGDIQKFWEKTSN